jgi:probable F420-dependent oxidoreductase
MSTQTMRICPDGELVFGIQLPVVAQSTMVAAPWEREPGTGASEIVRAAKAADDAGFFYVCVCDHIAIPEAYAPAMSTVWYDPIATLGFVAAHTTRTHLLTNVFVGPYRHPLNTASTFATLDALSGGRAILGMGAGHVAGEFEALGIPFEERGRLLNESIDGVLAAWEQEYVNGVGVAPRPTQQPRPPIWIGGSSKPAMRRVAERGDGWIPQGTPRAEMPDSIAYLLAHRDQVRPGADIDLGVITEYCYVGTPTFDVPENAVTGSAEQIAESLNEFGAMGVRHLQLRLSSRSCDELCDQITAFGAEVGPLLKG